MRKFRVISLSLALLFSAFSNARAVAQANKSILLVEMQGEGIKDEMLNLYDEMLRLEVKEVSGLNVLPKPALDFEGMKLAAGCAGGPECLRVIGRMTGAGAVLQSTLSGTNDRAKIEFVLVDVRSGKEKTLLRELVDLDGDDHSEFRNYVAELFGVKRTPDPGQIQLTLKSSLVSLESAEIFLDDQKVSLSRLAGVEPGNHRLEVRMEGYETFIWIGAVREARTTEVTVELKPAAAATPSIGTVTPPGDKTTSPSLGPDSTTTVETKEDLEKRGPESLLFTWILGGSSVVAGVTSAIFFFHKTSIENDLQERQLRGELGQPAIDPSTNEPTYCYQGSPIAEECLAGKTANVRNVGFGIAAGVLAVGAFTAFMVETSYFTTWPFGGGSSKDGGVAFSPSVSPVPGGGAHAAIHVQF